MLAEIVEKNPYVVDIVNALIFETFSKKSTLLLIVSTELLTVVRLLFIVTPELLIVSTELLTVVRLLLTVSTELLTVRTAPLLGIFVNKDPSPIN